MTPMVYKDTFNGIEYTLTLRQWAALTEITYHTVYNRHKKWREGKFPKKDILFQGVLDSNKRPPVPKNKIDIDVSWLYFSERPETTRIKRHWEMVEFRQWLLI